MKNTLSATLSISKSSCGSGIIARYQRCDSSCSNDAVLARASPVPHLAFSWLKTPDQTGHWKNTQQFVVVRAELTCLDAARFRRWHPHSNMRCVVLGTTGPSNQHNSKGCNGHHRDQQKPHASRRLLHQFWLHIRPTEGAFLATHPINVFLTRASIET